jgi:hypothetical protein
MRQTWLAVPRAETEEQGKRDALGDSLANNALTGQAAKLEAEISELRARLSKAQLVQNPNPARCRAGTDTGLDGRGTAAWQQAVVAAVFDLCLVGVMVSATFSDTALPASAQQPQWWRRW